MFEKHEKARSCIEAMSAAGRAEAQAAARRLDSIAELYVLRRAECGERERWVVDCWSAVTAEVAAGLRTSKAMASSYLRYGMAMRDRLPKVAELFRNGDISFDVFAAIVFRTDLITDEKVLATVDEQLAAVAGRWPSMTRGRLDAAIDRIVVLVDRDAVRRVREQVNDRTVSFWDNPSGISELTGRLFTTDAHLLEERLDALVATVCRKDPRSRGQRRADALGALAAGADRLACQCEYPKDCAAGKKPPAAPVVIHVVAEQATVEGRSQVPGVVMGSDWLVPPEVIAELAGTARLRPLVHPIDAEPEPNYRPSAALAAFVRARDLTCRAPGCDVPANECDIDHVIPWSEGGVTHAANLSCKCRWHHLLKTFWGWHDEQLPDGTLVWTLPSGQTHITTPGSAQLFPSLCVPTTIELAPPPPVSERCGHRTLMMPLRDSTRAQNRARYIAAERRHNHQTTTTPPAPEPEPDDEPPPF